MRRVAVVVAMLAWAPAAAAAPLTVHATFDTRTPQFGEAVRSHVVVLVDRTQVRPGSVHIVDDVAPLTALAAAGEMRTARGDTLVIAVDRTAACIVEACVSARGDATPALPRVTVTATSRAGRTLRATAAWPALRVRGRVSAADLARARPPFRADTAPPTPSYRLAPSTLARLLDAGAVVLALAAIAVAAWTLLPLARRRRASAPPDELARALRLAREAEARPTADRRRALGLLARLLDGRLAGAASGLAWSRPAPEPAELAALVDDVERETRP
jgi:hypothetical protein